MAAGLGASALLPACSIAPSGGVVASSDGRIRIGVSIWSATDAVGSLTINIIQRAADALGCSFTIVETKHV